MTAIIPVTKSGEALPVAGVVISTAADGSETRVSVNQYMREYGEPERITFGIYIGDHKWYKVELTPSDAKTVSDLILSKPAVAALAQDTDGAAKP